MYYFSFFPNILHFLNFVNINFSLNCQIICLFALSIGICLIFYVFIHIIIFIFLIFIYYLVFRRLLELEKRQPQWLPELGVASFSNCILNFTTVFTETCPE